jgi:hypothetical protein
MTISRATETDTSADCVAAADIIDQLLRRNPELAALPARNSAPCKSLASAALDLHQRIATMDRLRSDLEDMAQDSMMEVAEGWREQHTRYRLATRNSAYNPEYLAALIITQMLGIYRNLISDLRRRLIRLVDRIRAVLHLMLIRVLSALSRCPDFISAVLVLLAASRCFGCRTEPDDYVLPVLTSMSVVTGRLPAYG